MMQALKHDSGTLDHSAPCGRPCHGVWHYHYESAKHIGFNLKTPVMIGCADPCHSIFSLRRKDAFHEKAAETDRVNFKLHKQVHLQQRQWINLR